MNPLKYTRFPHVPTIRYSSYSRLQLAPAGSTLTRPSRSTHFSTSCIPSIHASSVVDMPPKRSGSNDAQDRDNGDQPHQFQAGGSTHRDQDQWKHREPYKIHGDNDNFDVKWKGQCHCGKVKYQLSRDKPLAAKYCHCSTCQRLHGAPFQWAAIFKKEDINFTNGIHDLGWYDSSNKSTTHHLPCKVSCAYCRTPIMDEGRNMILLFPPLIENISTDEAIAAFKPSCHMFYPQRVVDFKGDGLVKWKGLDNMSDLIDDDGKVLIEFKEGMEKDDMKEQKSKRLKTDK